MKSIKKALLSCASGILGVSTIITPTLYMVSCGNKGRMVDDTDQQYNVSSTTYDSMRRELDNLYYLQLEGEAYPKEVIEQKMAEMKEELSYLDSQASDLAATSSVEDAQKLGVDFTALTQALSEQSYKKYNIRLSRSSSAKWSNFLTYFNGLYDSSYIYMHNLQMSESTIQQRLSHAKERFNDLFESLREEYFYDPLLGITKGMPKLIECFEECNLEIALVSANERLNDFLNKYNFEMITDDPEVRYDKLAGTFEEGQKIEDDIMQKIFKCINRETKQSITFYGSGENAILPGYVLTPRFHAFKENNYNNTFAMQIDWEIYPVGYENSQYRDLVTSHVYGDNKDIREEKCDEHEEFAFNKSFQRSEIVYTEYALLPSPEYEAKKLLQTYLGTNNGQKITFSWNSNPQNPNNKYECFFDGIQSGHSKGLLNQESLADSGLMISDDDDQNFKPLREVMDWVKANNESDEPIPDEELTLSQKFVKYVVTESNVEITNAKKHLVTHNFKYHYITSQNGDDAIAVETQERHSDGFLVSASFFDKANNVFADTADVILRDYQRKRFTEVLVSCHKLESTFISTTAMTAVQIVKNVIKMIFAGFAKKLICALCIAMIGFNAVYLALSWVIYDNELIKPIEDFCDRVEKIRSHPSIYKLQLKFNNDRENWFCMKDESGQYDQKEYKRKRDNFVKADFDGKTRPLYQYYTTFAYQKDAKDFYDVCMQNQCDPYTFYKTFDSWQYSAWCYLIIYGYSGIRMAFNSVIMSWEEWTWTGLFIEMSLEFILSTIITKFCEKEIFHIDPNRIIPE